MMDAGVEWRVMHMIFTQETSIFVHFKMSITSPFHKLIVSEHKQSNSDSAYLCKMWKVHLFCSIEHNIFVSFAVYNT